MYLLAWKEPKKYSLELIRFGNKDNTKLRFNKSLADPNGALTLNRFLSLRKGMKLKWNF